MPSSRHIPEDTVNELLGDALFRCCLCPEHVNLTLDKHHIEPISEGGPNEEENLIVVCPNCHRAIHLARKAGLKQYTPEQLSGCKRRWIALCWREELTMAQRVEQALSVSLPPPKVSLAKLPVTDPDLFGREEELMLLDEAWADPDTRIMTLVAFGGVGKTALVNHWLERMGRDGYRGARRVFGWSFYSQGTKENYGSADQFVDAALRFFGDLDPAVGSSWDRGVRLAQLVRQQPTLLILDGIEPLQWGPGPQEGQLRDRAGGMYSLLRELSYGMEGLCIASSRIDLTDLPGSPGPGPVRCRDLENLSVEAGRAVLRRAGVEGPDAELDAAVAEYEGYALSLILLGEYLKEFLQADARRRDRVPNLHEETRTGGHAFRVMEAYDAALLAEGRYAERQILRILGLFDRPASKGCLDALCCKPSIQRTTTALVKLEEEGWSEAIGRLRRWRLVAPPAAHDDGSLDTHPMVREYFRRRLSRDSRAGFRAGHKRLYTHLCTAAEPRPADLRGIEPLFHAVYHGCQAGLYQETLDRVFIDRIQRRQEFYYTRKVGAPGAELAALSCFFALPWQSPTRELSRDAQGWLLNHAGYTLSRLGRLHEAVQPMREGLLAAATAQHWGDASRASQNLSFLFLSLGDLTRAEETAGEGVRSAERAGRAEERSGACACKAAVLHLQGSLSHSLALFEEAEQLQWEAESKGNNILDSARRELPLRWMGAMLGRRMPRYP